MISELKSNDCLKVDGRKVDVLLLGLRNEFYLHQKLSSRFLHLAARRQSQKLFTQNRRFSSRLHQTPEVLLVKTLHCIPLVKSFDSLSCLSRRNEMKPDEVAPCGSKDGVVYILNRDNCCRVFFGETPHFLSKISLPSPFILRRDKLSRYKVS